MKAGTVGGREYGGISVYHGLGTRRFCRIVAMSWSVRPHIRRTYSFTPPYRSSSIVINACIVSSLPSSSASRRPEGFEIYCTHLDDSILWAAVGSDANMGSRASREKVRGRIGSRPIRVKA